MADLRALIERVEKLEGPSREVDAEIAAALHPADDPAFEAGISGRDYPDLYTGSIDAAIALCERVLPGFGVSVETHPVYGDWWDAAVFDTMPKTVANARKQTPALAVCLATLRALEAQGGAG